MQRAIDRCALDLHDMVVLTEAATGAYGVTPVMAGMAGAKKVFAITRASRYGTVSETKAEAERLADLAGVGACVEVVTEKSKDMFSQADIVTNSGHVRPINAEVVGWMKATAVIPLMYEAWEFRNEDVDVAACRTRGIAIAGTHERHPSIDVFSFLGTMAVKLLLDAGITPFQSRILLLCDNPFGPFLANGLAGAGAVVEMADSLARSDGTGGTDAVLVALKPLEHPIIGAAEAALIRKHRPGAVVLQFWGDLDRADLSNAEVLFWPPYAPRSGHMGILPSDVGPEPIVRLQSGGLKVGQIMASIQRTRASARRMLEAVDAAVLSGFGQALLPRDAKSDKGLS